ncbi:Hypothetical protein D9617_18g033840 [Elsinoe fawcettii]|nr:Hypothetical protein D9617_18g033840 [Elsinoe fawcettii]
MEHTHNSAAPQLWKRYIQNTKSPKPSVARPQLEQVLLCVRKAPQKETIPTTIPPKQKQVCKHVQNGEAFPDAEENNGDTTTDLSLSRFEAKQKLLRATRAASEETVPATPCVGTLGIGE